MSLKINTDKVSDIINKIDEITGSKKDSFDEKKGTVIENAKNYAETWPSNTAKIEKLMRSIDVTVPRHQARFYVGGIFSNDFQQEIYDAAVQHAKRNAAEDELKKARDVAKGIAGTLDTQIVTKMTSVVETLKEVRDSMHEVLDYVQIFEESEVPNFSVEIVKGTGERIQRYREDLNITDPGFWGWGSKDPLNDLLNNSNALRDTGGVVAPSTISVSIPEGKRDYSDTKSTEGGSTQHPPLSFLTDDNTKYTAHSDGSGSNPKTVDIPYGSVSNGNRQDEPIYRKPNSNYQPIRSIQTDDDGKDLNDSSYSPSTKDDNSRIGDLRYQINQDKKNSTGGNVENQYVSNNNGSSSTNINDGSGSSTLVSSNIDDSKVKANQLDNSTSIADNIGMLTGRTESNDSSFSQFDNSHKSGLAGALGIVAGGPSVGISGGLGGVTNPGVDMFSGLNGLNGVNIPNISIGGYNPYSINIGSGSTLNFSNFDSSSLYNNVNFYTTPGMETIQSPNQLLEQLNSLPESIRKRISSMDLDNRAESAYFNSMSNEEFDDIKNKQITKFRSMTKEQIKDRLKKQGYTDEEIEIIANNENIGVIAFLVGEQNVTMEALRKAITPDGVVLEEDKDERPSLEELVSGEAAAKLLNPYQDEEVRKAVEEYEYAKEKFNRAVSKSNASSKALKVANEKLRKTRIDIEQIDGKDINKWTKEHIVKYNDCVKIFMEEKENATNDLIATLNAEKEFQVAMEALKEAKAKFNKKMAEAVSVDPSVLLLIEQNKKKKENGEETEKEPKQEPFAMISKKMVMPDLQMHNIGDVEILEETGSLSASDKAVVEQSVSQSVETYQTEQPVVENKPAENVPKEETVGSMEINGKKIQITKPTNNFVEAPEKE